MAHLWSDKLVVSKCPPKGVLPLRAMVQTGGRDDAVDALAHSMSVLKNRRPRGVLPLKDMEPVD